MIRINKSNFNDSRFLNVSVLLGTNGQTKFDLLFELVCTLYTWHPNMNLTYIFMDKIEPNIEEGQFLIE